MHAELPQPGFEPVFPVVEAGSLNHWTTGVVLLDLWYMLVFDYLWWLPVEMIEIIACLNLFSFLSFYFIVVENIKHKYILSKILSVQYSINCMHIV